MMIYIVGGLFLTAISGWAVATNQLTPAQPAHQANPSKQLIYYSEAESGKVETALRHWSADGLTLTTGTFEAADFTLSTKAKNSESVLLPVTTTAGRPLPLQNADIIAPDPADSLYLTPLKPNQDYAGQTGHERAAQIASHLQASASPSWSLTALGDIIIGREVYMKILQYGPLHPFEPLAAQVAAADLTIADLENAFSDPQAVISHTGMSFVSPTNAAAGLLSAGIDAVSLANNHSYNGGATGFTNTMATLNHLGIGYFGGGANISAARQPLIRTVKGIRVALLGYSSIVGSVPAATTSPGMNYLTMAPWGQLQEDQIRQMETDIQTASSQADVVIPYFHWGSEYTHDANADQRLIAHRAIDAGATLVLGSHPHWVQGVEWYHDRLIAYSLGNFVFDQEWSIQTKQGAYLEIGFSGSKVAHAQLKPYIIQDYHQPVPAGAEAAAGILRNIFMHSWWQTP